MQAGEIYLVFTERLEELGLRYMVTGSVASSSYGEPRFTHDIDLIVAMRADRIAEFIAAFPLEEFYCPPIETITTEMRRGGSGQFNLIHHESGFKADIYVAGSDELTNWAFDNRQRVELLPGRSIDVAPREYVIVGKLQFFKEGGGERHIRDIRMMLEVDGANIDRELLDQWVVRLDLEAVWKIILED